MQACDVFYLKTNICQLGLDQRKVNVLAREYAHQIKTTPPTIVSSVMIPGLKEGQFKMSKSDPDSAIFMEDTADEVRRKIKNAFCKPGVVEENPVIEWTKYFVFGKYKTFTIIRKAENGGDM